MRSFEEQCHDSEEEHLALGTQEGGEIRMLGTWVDRRQDLEQRKKRGRYALITIRKRSMNSSLTKTTQAMIIQAVVESTMTFNCEIRTWQRKEDAKNSRPRMSLCMDEQEKGTSPKADGGEAGEHVGNEKKSWS